MSTTERLEGRRPAGFRNMLEAAVLAVALSIHDEAVVVWRPSKFGRSRESVMACAHAIMSRVPASLPQLLDLPVEPEINTSVRRSLGD